MSKVKFELNLKGLNQLMKSPEMQSILTQLGSRVMTNANASAQDPDAKYSMSIEVLNWVAVAQIRADNGEAVHENYENNTLLKSLR